MKALPFIHCPILEASLLQDPCLVHQPIWSLLPSISARNTLLLTSSLAPFCSSSHLGNLMSQEALPGLSPSFQSFHSFHCLISLSSCLSPLLNILIYSVFKVFSTNNGLFQQTPVIVSGGTPETQPGAMDLLPRDGKGQLGGGGGRRQNRTLMSWYLYLSDVQPGLILSTGLSFVIRILHNETERKLRDHQLL